MEIDDRAEAGSELELETSNVAHGGIFVARHEGRVVFVSDTLPGERVRARLTEDRHSSFWRASAVKILEPSPHRREHIWSEAAIDREPGQRAGGAEFGHIELTEQRRLKQQVLTENLERMASVLSTDEGVDSTVRAIPGNADGTGWRTRVRLQVDDAGRMGPFSARSHDVIETDSLPLAVPGIEAAARELRAASGSATRLSAGSVDLVAPSAGPVRVVAQDGPRGETVYEQVGARTFALELGGFWQVHVEAAATLGGAVGELLDEARFDPSAQNLDLYGGVGLLAAAVLDRFGTATAITTVESEAAATGHARENLRESPAAEAVTRRVDRYLSELRKSSTAKDRGRLRRSSVVLDPPRSGAGRQVVDQLVALEPAQILYVACDPVALARDLGVFRRSGYAVQRLAAYDLFPHTHHVEAVALLVRE